MLYPLKFIPIYKDKIWGGKKIKTVLGKDFGTMTNCGESWELSGVHGNISIVREGEYGGTPLKNLIGQFKSDITGRKIYSQFGDNFPLLIKFIDANEDLSIQVHPGDELAKKRHQSPGKTEMWYIIQADKGSKLISGFNKEINPTIYKEYLQQGKLQKLLNEVEVNNDDVFFIPAGRVHTIGKGLLLAEIQQSSDVTYRIYDFDRVDDQGNKRELHAELAVNAIDYAYYPEHNLIYNRQTRNEPVNLVDSPYFTTNRLLCDKMVKRDFRRLDSFVIYICLEGNGLLHYDSGDTNIIAGDVVLVPAAIDNVQIHPQGEVKLVESYIAG